MLPAHEFLKDVDLETGFGAGKSNSL